MKTAIQQLAQDIFESDLTPECKSKLVNILHKHLTTEKQQIIDACYSGKMMQYRPADKTPEQYYNETFGEL